MADNYFGGQERYSLWIQENAGKLRSFAGTIRDEKIHSVGLLMNGTLGYRTAIYGDIYEYNFSNFRDVKGLFLSGYILMAISRQGGVIMSSNSPVACGERSCSLEVFVGNAKGRPNCSVELFQGESAQGGGECFFNIKEDLHLRYRWIELSNESEIRKQLDAIYRIHGLELPSETGDN